MHDILIQIEAFGAVKQALPETIQMQCLPGTAIADLLLQLNHSYPVAAALVERCACAIGEDIVPRQQTLQHSTTLVLLSPVAGG
ncbi:MoaD/ThiS family protein [Acinetobacter indicus]|uniref:MoaD/ThiS family protein n=1 Tax=Acinetobacter indicus TaxID=756892 RepID=UPI000CEBB56F|nr:MoaD/ThiS family protein [Acinetobacter indicus]QIZ61811.1 MoaD/ThiS family protein [Acinetobacter indicus]